jgi:transcription antitermination factor NusA-like protein
MLCRTCRERLEKGMISDTDVDVARTLMRLSVTIKSLRDITLKQAVESDNLILIVCDRGDAARVIGRSGLTVKRLEKELGKPVRIVEDARDLREFIVNLLNPVPVLGVNVLYKPRGEVIRVLVGGGQGPRIKSEDVRGIVKTKFGKDVEIEGA